MGRFDRDEEYVSRAEREARFKRRLIIGACICLVFVVGLIGLAVFKAYFLRKYQVEVSQIVLPHQTAFYVPMEGDIKDQKKLDSVEAYENHKVACKRIVIPTRWNKTGRLPNQGDWLELARLIVADRSPVTRHWTSEASTGTNPANQAVWLESKDSIAFNAPFACSCYVPEDMSSTFLFWYPGKASLAAVMDGEIRNKIQEVGTEFASQQDLDVMRTMKEKMNEYVRGIVIPFFEKRGIVITFLGLAGGLEYKNENIQSSIDGVFIAQQQKNIESAKLDAARIKEKRLTGEGQAEAAMAREVAKGKASATETMGKAKGDAEALIGQAQADAAKLVMGALNEATSPAFLDLLWLEVELEKIEGWDGSVPALASGESLLPVCSGQNN